MASRPGLRGTRRSACSGPLRPARHLIGRAGSLHVMTSEVRSGIDMTQLDRDIRPQDDLFRHVNGGWLDSATIPQDQAVYGNLHRLRDEAEAQLREIVDEVSAGDAEDGTPARKVGDLYASFMDSEQAERLGAG